MLVCFSRTQACEKIRLSNCSRCEVHLETKLEFAYTVVASLQVWADPCLNS